MPNMEEEIKKSCNLLIKYYEQIMSETNTRSEELEVVVINLKFTRDLWS